MSLIYGADYNPDQWKMHPEIIDEDMRLMKLAGMNEMTIGIFSWAELEKSEGEYDFSFLDMITDKLYENGINFMLATPSGARPAWLSHKYPEVLRTTDKGEKCTHGSRHNHCFTSPVYRSKVREINRRLAERYKNHPGLIMWHVSNEYGGECHCELCKNAFREWLKKKYDNDLEKLNYQWWNSFWSHTYTDWSQIDPPSPLGETNVHAMNLDWKRFVTDQTIDFYENECAPLREITPNVPITTNFHWPELRGVNYQKFASHVDTVSWDAYPMWHHDKDCTVQGNDTAFVYDLNRSLKHKPFLLMESTPSCISYVPVNKMKRTNMMITSALQAVAHGSDSVQYFQWRKSRGGCEKFHGAVVDHCGHENTRVFKGCADIGEILKEISDVQNAKTNAEAAIIYDWESAWALDDAAGFLLDNKGYRDECVRHHKFFWERSIATDVISPDDDFSKYKIIAAPMLYSMSEKTVEKIRAYVENGGIFVTTYITGYVNENDLCYLGGFPAGVLKEVFGIWNEEIDTMYEWDSVSIKSIDGKEYTAKDYCELIHADTAETLAEYTSDYMSGTPCVTCNSYGKGKAYYIAFRDGGQFLTDFYAKITKDLFETETLPEGVTAMTRETPDAKYTFIQNFSDKSVCVSAENIVYSKHTPENGKVEIEAFDTVIKKK